MMRLITIRRRSSVICHLSLRPLWFRRRTIRGQLRPISRRGIVQPQVILAHRDQLPRVRGPRDLHRRQSFLRRLAQWEDLLLVAAVAIHHDERVTTALAIAWRERDAKRDATVNASLAKQTGMWAKPLWSLPDARGESRIAFGVALAPSNSERSRCALVVMDRDGGNKQQIFPLSQSPEDGLTTMQIAWSPDARQLIAVRENDLWLYDVASSNWAQLTANGASSKPQWAK
jgi:hypothetical protein